MIAAAVILYAMAAVLVAMVCGAWIVGSSDATSEQIGHAVLGSIVILLIASGLCVLASVAWGSK